jgi:transaldolase
MLDAPTPDEGPPDIASGATSLVRGRSRGPQKKLEEQRERMSPPPTLGIKVFADGADLEGILRLADDPSISGFTTNPTLMRKAGVDDYEGFARKVLDHVTDRPISFEVFSDDFDEMRRQAVRIGSWGSNVYVKIPVTNTKGESAEALVRELSAEGLRLNVTAILSLQQVSTVVRALETTPGAVVSVFAGRVADTGRDPVPLMSAALELTRTNSHVELLWASPREVLNVCQAESIGCDIITVTHDLLAKLAGLGRDLEDVSLDTVRMFHDDAASAGYLL